MERNSVLDTSEAQLGFLPRFMQRIPKLGSILKISQPIVTALLSSNPYTAAAITTTYIVTGEILNHIERRNLEVWLKAYVDRNIEELITQQINIVTI